MKPKYPKMPPPPKTEEERLRYRILEPEAEKAILKKLQELNQAKMRKNATPILHSDQGWQYQEKCVRKTALR